MPEEQTAYKQLENLIKKVGSGEPVIGSIEQMQNLMKRMGYAGGQEAVGFTNDYNGVDLLPEAPKPTLEQEPLSLEALKEIDKAFKKMKKEKALYDWRAMQDKKYVM